MKVLLIAEDFRKDRYILEPVLKKLIAAAGLNAKVTVCIDPFLGGTGEALKWDRISEIIEMYPMVDLFVLVIDRDGKDGRRASLDHLETKARARLASDSRWFVAENAWQEVEVWALAGIDKKWIKEWEWNAIRNEVDPKEVYFEKVAQQRGLLNEPGQGRTTLGREAAQNYPRIRTLCPEDVAKLEQRIRDLNGA